jgi:hypothetical protein
MGNQQEGFFDVGHSGCYNKMQLLLGLRATNRLNLIKASENATKELNAAVLTSSSRRLFSIIDISQTEIIKKSHKCFIVCSSGNFNFRIFCAEKEQLNEQ